MQRKWLIALVFAAISAIVAATGLLPAGGTDFAWGLAVGLGIGGVIAWFIERRG